MSPPSALIRFWRALARPREPLLHLILRRRATRRALAFDGRGKVRDAAYYDDAIRAYLALWLIASSEEEHFQTAAARFGLDENGVHFVDQVLCSASLGTLRNWANCHDDPWWLAAWRLAESRDRSLLNPLRWQIEQR